MPKDLPHLILGAGPAGLGAALSLGDSAQVLERKSGPGGLCETITLDGAVFDLGGHSFHTPHPEIRELVFNALPMVEQKREAWCFFQGQWLPYPFQKNIHRINDVTVREACLEGLKSKAPESRPASNLYDHLERKFGKGISNHFLRPYNEKIWKGDLRQLASEWTRERVSSANPSAKPSLNSRGKRLPLEADTIIAYPARGSFCEIFYALAQRVPYIRYGQSVVQIDPLSKTVFAETGQWAYEKLISTLSLPKLIDLLTVVPTELRKKARELKTLPLCLAMITIDGRFDGHVQRIYSAGEETPAHKIVFNHTSSPFLRDLPNHGILAEVSGHQSESDETIIHQVVEGLKRMGYTEVISRIRSTKVIRVSGYPVPTLDRREIVDELRTWLLSLGILTVGRFGEWAYINSDEALYRGINCGEKVKRDRLI